MVKSLHRQKLFVEFYNGNRNYPPVFYHAQKLEFYKDKELIGISVSRFENRLHRLTAIQSISTLIGDITPNFDDLLRVKAAPP